MALFLMNIKLQIILSIMNISPTKHDIVYILRKNVNILYKHSDHVTFKGFRKLENDTLVVL